MPRRVRVRRPVHDDGDALLLTGTPRAGRTGGWASRHAGHTAACKGGKAPFAHERQENKGNILFLLG
jgi:hypothetical protein